MRFIRRLVDIFIPHSCEICGGELSGEGNLCAACRDRFIGECFEHCPLCGKTAFSCICHTDFTKTTKTVLGGRAFFSLTFYQSEKEWGKQDRITEKLIFGLKEHGRYAQFFADEMCRGISKILTDAGEDVHDWAITYPPRSTEKLYGCGFDQSELVCEKLAKALGCRAVKTMVRGGRSAEQKTLGASERRTNTESTLVPIRRNIAEGGKYLLLDDIITSGATIETAAKLLYECGAAAVFPISIARTETGNTRRR